MTTDPPSVLDLFRLDGKVAVVTGAGSGLGAGFALALAEAGAEVVIAGRRHAHLEATAEAVTAIGRRCLAIPTDVTDPAQCTALVTAAVESFGQIDVLVNNAGVAPVVPASTDTPEDFRAVIDVNLLAAFWMAQACAKVMPRQSSIVNVSSMLGLIKSILPQASYAASKAGLIGLTRDLSSQWAGRKGIRVNAIAPGFVDTEMTHDMPAETMAGFMAGCTLGRTGTQREIDTAIVFLASAASSYITGSTLAIDGGTSGH